MSFTSKESSTRIWYALDVASELAAGEAVEYALMEAGALGTQTEASEKQLLRVSGYFKELPDRQRVRIELMEALRVYELPSSAVRDMSIREVVDQDWLGEWKKSWQPVEVGERFIIAPPWAEGLNERNRLVVRIEPGMAFGTGTHETTRLCLRAIEQYFTGESFLDVGTGTGILAIAAAKLFPDARVEGCDTDQDAIEIARENARLNETPDIQFYLGSVGEITASADLVCANLTADVISQLLPRLLAVTCSRLILSGILETQTEAMISRLRECGVSARAETFQDGEWIALII